MTEYRLYLTGDGMRFEYFGQGSYATAVMDLRRYDHCIDELEKAGAVDVQFARKHGFVRLELDDTVTFILNDSKGIERRLETCWTAENMRKRGLQFC